MDMKKIVAVVVAVAVLGLAIAGVSFVVRLVSGLVSGAFNLVLGALVIIALIAIVAWMFWYAGKHK